MYRGGIADRIVPIILVFSGACGGGSASQSEGTAPVADELPRTEVAESTGPGTIDRALLLTVLDGGLGRFLQGVETEPVVIDGQFVGFRLVSLFPQDARFRDVGIEPGDVVTRVNGQPIERPEQAVRVWDGLRVASELVIEYQRQGESSVVRFAIEDTGESR